MCVLKDYDWCHQDSPSAYVTVDSILLKLEVIVVNWLALDYLIIIFWIVELFQEWMLQDLLSSEPLLWVISEELLHQVNCLRRCIWKVLCERFPLDCWSLILHVLEEFLASDLFLDCLIW